MFAIELKSQQIDAMGVQAEERSRGVSTVSLFAPDTKEL